MSEFFPAAIIGFALGAAWFGTLRTNTDLYLAGGPLWRPIGLQVLRLAMAGIAFTALAWVGALALLTALAAFLLARAVLLRAGGARAP